jgi:succinoglycan biosynthesis protein ExoM
MVDVICVCICTYKRPEMLGRLLRKLAEQQTEGLFDYSVVVVDNDRLESARQTVESFARKVNTSISYHVEPEQNIALARNKAIENAKGDFIGLIDDDEFPDKHWLITLTRAIKQFGSDGILGPVLPYFETEPPKWVMRGHFFERPSHPTGHILDWQNTRTGNALLKRQLFKDHDKWFDPTYGSGGEDRAFFRRLIDDRRVFVWCQEAFVFETVAPTRWKRTTLLKRALLRGKVALNGARSKPASVIKSVVAVTIYTVGLPLFLLLGHHIFMKYLIKDCDHLGKIFAFVGIDLVKEKYVGG